MIQPNPNLDIRHLRLLDQLYATQSVSRTAEALGQGQPAISIGLGKLRTLLNDPLFVRTAQGMLPTPRVEALMPTVREILEGLERLAQLDQAFDAATAQRRFAICMTDDSHVTLLPRLLAHVRALAPGVTLAATRIDGDLANKLQSGVADLALGYLPWLDTGFYQHALYTQDWICLVNRQHPRIRCMAKESVPENWNVSAYQREEHVSISAGTGVGLMEEAFQNQHITRRIGLELPGFLGLSAILSTSDLVATLPRQIGETLARSANLRALPCPVTIAPFTVKQYWHARFGRDTANRWLRGVCAGLFMQHPPQQAKLA